MQCSEGRPLAKLHQKESVTASLTLLRGRNGSLFPNSGLHYIEVVLEWGSGSSGVIVKGCTTVFITPPITASHAAAAHRMLTTPDTHLVLAIGGDHLSEGINAIQRCLEEPTLEPHYAAIEAKRIASPSRQRPADKVAARKSLYPKMNAVMSNTERAKLTRMDMLRAPKPEPEAEEQKPRSNRVHGRLQRLLEQIDRIFVYDVKVTLPSESRKEKISMES